MRNRGVNLRERWLSGESVKRVPTIRWGWKFALSRLRVVAFAGPVVSQLLLSQCGFFFIDKRFITADSSPQIHHRRFITADSSPQIHHRRFITAEWLAVCSRWFVKLSNRCGSGENFRQDGRSCLFSQRNRITSIFVSTGDETQESVWMHVLVFVTEAGPGSLELNDLSMIAAGRGCWSR